MPSRRTGKPYIWVTWLAKLLGGNECLWSAWFKAHFRYDRYEEQALDLAQWNRDHTRLMKVRRQELEEAGWTVHEEDENAFKLEGASAVVAGKPDIVAVRPGETLIVDGKTGRERDSDIWQVMFYLFALPKVRRIEGELTGEVQYANGDQRITIAAADVSAERLAQITNLIQVVSAPTPPRRVPSRHECSRCNIGPIDCPERVRELHGVAAEAF